MADKEWKTKKGSNVIKVLSGRSNVFLCTTGKKIFLVDTGLGRNWKKLCKGLFFHNVKKLDYLILTHSHYDHAENTNRLKTFFAPEIIVHRAEIEFLQNGENVPPKGTNPFTGLLTRVFLSLILKMMRYEKSNADILVDQIFFLPQTNDAVKIIHTPGHTRGSVSVLIDDEIALAGDTLFGVLKSSVFPPFAENKKELIKSWGRLLQSNCTLFLPSHGKEKTREQLEKDFIKHQSK